MKIHQVILLIQLIILSSCKIDAFKELNSSDLEEINSFEELYKYIKKKY